MHTILLAKLLLDPATKSKTEFLRAHPNPALLVEPLSTDVQTSDLDGSTPFSLPSWWRPTPTNRSRAADDKALVRIETARIVWLQKTPRNPFENLITLGRAPNNDLRFKVDSISKLHATFNRSGDRWFVQDHASTNGTFVNGERLGGGALRNLQDGDAVQFAPELRARFFSSSALFDYLAIVARFSASPT